MCSRTWGKVWDPDAVLASRNASKNARKRRFYGFTDSLPHVLLLAHRGRQTLLVEALTSVRRLNRSVTHDFRHFYFLNSVARRNIVIAVSIGLKDSRCPPMLRSLTLLALVSTAVGLAVGGEECCGDQCSSTDDCAAGLFCCPNHNECMDTTTKSTIGPNCDACNPPSSPAAEEKKCGSEPAVEDA